MQNSDFIPIFWRIYYIFTFLSIWKIKSDMKYNLHTIFIVLVVVFYVSVELNLLREPNSKLDFDFVIKKNE